MLCSYHAAVAKGHEKMEERVKPSRKRASPSPASTAPYVSGRLALALALS